ncbi:MAG: transporter substrate-binding domain-containing protein [Syntrophobacterales bacterium]|nr:transporter substrate-binding domain-containing protein [Syntrophobacterales bacterium]
MARYIIKRAFFLMASLFLFTLISGFLEKAFALKELHVVIDNDYPPYVMKDSQNNLIGILPELWYEFEKKTGIKVILIGADWLEAQKIIMEGKADLIDTLFKTVDREQLYDFSKPYVGIPVSIFHHKSLSGITDTHSIRGFTIAVKAGDACIDILKRDGISLFRLYPGYEAIVRDAKEGNVKIFCMDEPPAIYYLEKYGISNEFRRGFPLYVGQFHRAVRKGMTDLLTIVEEGFNSIPDKKVKAVHDRWKEEKIYEISKYSKYLWPISFAILLLISLIGIWNFFLHRVVQRKTQELRRSIEIIRDREQLLQVTLDNLEDGVVIANNKGRVSKLNKSAMRFIYSETEEYIGKYPHEIFHVSDRRSGEDPILSDKIEKAIHDNSTLHVRDGLLVTRSSDQPHFIELTISPIPVSSKEEGDHYGVVIVFHDVTEEKIKSRELEIIKKMFHLAVEGAQMGIVTFNIPLGIMYRNEISNRIMGMEPSNSGEPIETWFPLIHPDHKDRVRRSIFSHSSKEAQFYDDEYPLKHSAGHYIWIHVRGRIIERDEHGNPIWYGGILFDITNRKASDEKLKKLEKELAKISKFESLGRLAGGIAHDFNNILMVLLGYGEMVSKELDDKHPSRDKLEQMLISAERAAQLTKQLLTFSRKQPSNPEFVNINELISNFKQMLVRLVGEDVELKMNLSDEPLYLFVDPAEMEQVILNLAINARDAMPQGGTLLIGTALVESREVYIDSHPNTKPKRYVLISVTDTGHGMDAETLEQIFEPFFSTKPEGKGTGLGLSIVYGIVKRAGGEIHVYSEPKRGTTFKIYIPAVESKESKKTMESISTETAYGLGERIMVVEDNEELRNLMVNYLKKVGYCVIWARHGKEALSIIEKEGKPDLVITDVIMPEMNGGTLAQEIKKRFGEIKVIYMSGYPKDVIDKYDVYESDITLIMKPFKIGDFLKTIREKLDKPKPK